MMNLIKETIKENMELKQAILEDINLLKAVENCAVAIINCLKKGNKILVCGNGGSAGDAQHIAGEFINKFYYDRPAMACIALSTDTSVITAIANDSNFDEVFARQVMALGRKGDVFWGISTSGNSQNIIKAMQTSKNMGLIVIGYSGEKACIMDELSDFVIKIPSTVTPRIQEVQILISHIICQLVEQAVTPRV